MKLAQRMIAPAMVLGAALAAPPAEAWSAAGHMVVAQIAYERLDDPTRVEVERLVSVLAGFEPVSADVVTASLWMDQVRSAGWRSFDRWHYINLPFNADGVAETPPVDTDNAVEAVKQAVRTLSDPEAPDLAKAVMLRVLLHVVGDLHQPLHTACRVTLAQPDGDRGGNDFPLLDLEGEPSNLHRLWDRTVGLLPVLEGSVEELGQVRSLAAGIVRAVPDESMPEWQVLDPEIWAQEGFRLATSVVYVGITEGRSPPEVYRVKSQLVARRRIAMAGYRLAALLSSVIADGARPSSP